MIQPPTAEQINDAMMLAGTVSKEHQLAVIDAVRHSANNSVIEDAADSLFCGNASPLAMLRGLSCTYMVMGMILASKRGDAIAPSMNFDLPTVDDFSKLLENTDLNSHPELCKASLGLAMSQPGMRFAAQVVNVVTRMQGGNTTASMLANGIAIGILWSQTAAIKRMGVQNEVSGTV